MNVIQIHVTKMPLAATCHLDTIANVRKGSAEMVWAMMAVLTSMNVIQIHATKMPLATTCHPDTAAHVTQDSLETEVTLMVVC